MWKAEKVINRQIITNMKEQANEIVNNLTSTWIIAELVRNNEVAADDVEMRIKMLSREELWTYSNMARQTFPRQAQRSAEINHL